MLRPRLLLCFRAAALAAALFVGPGQGLVGCSEVCDGVEIEGRCEKACHDDACAPSTKCYRNACRTPCQSAAGCLPNESCTRITTDEGLTGAFCVGPPKKNGSPAGGGEGAPCDANADCAGRFGYHCVEKACRLTCDYHGHCGALGSCSETAEDVEGNAVRLCAPDDAERDEGQYGSPCPNGSPDCDTAAGFVCHGAGAGDADGYCTKSACTGDAQCPSGSYCSAELSRRDPCEDLCGFGASTAADCVPSTDVGPGKKYECSQRGLVANVCVHRQFCSACESDEDCMGEPNQVCAKDQSGTKICTVRCTPGRSSCPWGNSAECGNFDSALGYPTCAHRFQSCRGTGKSCEPCVEDADCPDGWCQKAGFTGERYCVDTTATCKCQAGAQSSCVGGGCPTTPEPGGLPMTCLAGARYEDTLLFGTCFGAKTDPTEPSKESCWPGG